MATLTKFTLKKKQNLGAYVKFEAGFNKWTFLEPNDQFN